MNTLSRVLMINLVIMQQYSLIVQLPVTAIIIVILEQCAKTCHGNN